ncbi:hypothetical protein MTO96_051438 [Rhipicephalus appendiculatus]
MLYASGLESVHIKPDIGLEIRFRSEGQLEVWTHLGLVFSDSIVHLTEDQHQLQKLVTILAHHLTGLVLRFKPQKLAVVQFAGEVDTDSSLELLNEDQLPFTTEHR